MNTDFLDKYCKKEFGHIDWQMSWDAEGNLVITFFKKPRKEFLKDLEGERR